MAIYYIGLPLLIIAAVLDATLMPLFSFWGGAPSLVLMIIISWGLLVDINDSLPWAIMGGVMHDLLSVVPTGSSALAFILILVVLDQFLPDLSWRNWIVPPLIIGGATIIYYWVLFIIMLVAGWAISPFWGTVYIILPSTAVNIVLSPLVYRTIGAITNFLRPQRTSSLV